MKKHPLRKPVKKLASGDEDASFKGWAIVELMGHRKLAGHCSEVAIAGAAFLRLDVPSDPPVTQFYGGSAIYCITPTTEDLARKVAAASRPTPVHAYELPAPRESAQTRPLNADVDDFDADTGGQHDAPDCGGCGEQIAEGEPVTDVAADDGGSEMWHQGCAEKHAAMGDIDAENPL